MAGAPFAHDRVAATYARYRRASPHVLAELHRGASLNGASSILEVGSGTGNHVTALAVAAGCRGLGVEPAWEMVKQAPFPPGVTFVQGTAAHLPVASGSFDLLFSVNVIHHLPDTAAYFRATLRTLRPGGWLCTVTDSAAIIRRRRPLAQYWPETVAADLARYPAPDLLVRQMTAAGFAGIEVREIGRTFSIGDAGPYRERAFSCLHLIPEAAFHRGLSRLEQDLQQGPVAGLSEFACVWGRKG